MKPIKLLCLATALLLMLSLFAGCKTGGADATAAPTAAPAKPAAPAESTAPAENSSDPLGLLEEVAAYSSADVLSADFALPENVPPLKLPLTDTVQKVSIWELTPMAATNMVDYGDGETWKELEKRLGIDFEFISASTTNPQESYTLHIASQEFADIMTNTNYYVGGIDKAVSDGVFVDLRDYTDYIPHYMAVVNSSDQNKRDAFTDSGKMGHFCSIMYKTAETMNINGMVYRKDMLEKSGYGKPLPETWDEWTDMLTYLRDSYNLPESMMIESTGVSLFNSVMMTGLGLVHTYVMRDGKVEYSRITPEYKTYLTYLNDWYTKKFIAQDFYTYNPMSQYTQMTELCGKDELFTLNGWTAFAGDFYKKIGAAQNPDFYIAAIKDPVVTKGDKPMSRSYVDAKMVMQSNKGWAVTTGADDPALIMRVLDYFYSSEGALLVAYGPTEGKDADDVAATYYRDADGRPMVTKLLSANPEGLNMGAAFMRYCLHTSAPYMIWNRETDIYDDGMKATIDVWSDVSRDGPTSVLPSNYSTTSDEGAEISTIMGDIGTYVDEMTVKFIIGQEPLANYDAYVQQVKSMNVDRALELQQAAVERYLNRGK